MRDRVIALFIIIAMVCIIAACDKNIDNDIEVSTNSTEEPQINEQNPDFGSINHNKGTSITSDTSDNKDNLADKEIELLEYGIGELWNWSYEPQNLITKDISEDELGDWIYSFFLKNFFNNYLDIETNAVNFVNFAVAKSDIKRITKDFFGTDVDYTGENNPNRSYYDKENEQWVFPIADGEPQPSADIRNIKYDDMYLTITGYVRLGYCEEYSYTYDPLFKFVAQAVINPESKFGCTLEEIRYGNKDYIESIEASSELTDAYGTYYGKNIIDDDYKTAWVPDNKGDAVGEYILVNLDKERPLYGFAIANGYFKSLSTFENNGKARSIKLEFDNEEIKYDLTIPDRFEGIDGLTDTTAYSDIFYFDEPIVTRRVKIVLMETEPGMKYNDICISDIQLLY